MWMKIFMGVVLAVIVVSGIAEAQTPTIYTYTVTWDPNTEADLAGYMLESTNDLSGAGGWIMENATIARSVTSIKITSTSTGKCFRLSAYDTAVPKNISAPSQHKCRQVTIIDTIKPAAPNLQSVDVVIIDTITVPDVSAPKVLFNANSIMIMWAPVDAETEIWLANSAQGLALMQTANSQADSIELTPMVGGWQCINYRHRVAEKTGNWAQADPQNNPADINFCGVSQ